MVKPKQPTNLTGKPVEAVPPPYDPGLPWDQQARLRGSDMPIESQESLLARDGDLDRTYRGPNIPYEERTKRAIEDEEDRRALRGGLPDSPEDMPARATESAPARFTR